MTKVTYVLPVGETIQAAWHKTQGAKLTLWKAFGVMILLGIALGLLKSGVKASVPSLLPIATLVIQFIAYFLQIGLLYIGIQRAYDLPISYRMVFHAFKKELIVKVFFLYVLQTLIFFILSLMSFLGFLYGSILGVLGVVISICLLIIVTLRLYVAIGLVVDKSMHAWEAIKLSFYYTRGNVWPLLGLMLMTLLILTISFVLLGIGLIWTLPFSFVLYGVTYKNLLNNT